MASAIIGDNAATDEGATVQAKPTKRARKPHTLGLVIDAISHNSERKGVTVNAIKKHLTVGVSVIIHTHSNSVNYTYYAYISSFFS